MTRESEVRLLQFCAQQQDRFDAAEWLCFKFPSRDELAAAAVFLAGADWYSHHRELREVANQLRPGSVGDLSKLVRATGFDCARFSNMLRRELRHALAAS